MDGQSLSERVIEATAAEVGTSPLDLDPLYTVVDPDALDALFRSSSPGVQRSEGHVEFTFAGVRVTIDQDSSVDVSAVSEDGQLHPPNVHSDPSSESIESE